MSEAWHGGKGDKPRSVNLDSYRRNYENIFGKNKNIKRIFLDLDETLISTTCSSSKDDIESTYNLYSRFYDKSEKYLLLDGIYYYSTFLRNCAIDIINFCKNLAGEENCFILTLGGEDYSKLINAKFDLGFPDSHIYNRDHLSADFQIEKFHQGKNILVDNENYKYHLFSGKVDFLNLKEKPENIIQIPEFKYYEKDILDEKEEFNKLKDLIENKFQNL